MDCFVKSQIGVWAMENGHAGLDPAGASTLGGWHAVPIFLSVATGAGRVHASTNFCVARNNQNAAGTDSVAVAPGDARATHRNTHGHREVWQKTGFHFGVSYAPSQSKTLS